MSSPVLTTTVTSSGRTMRTSPRRNFPAPTPPASAVTRIADSVVGSLAMAEATPQRTRSDPSSLPLEEVVAIAEAGRALGCKEALFTLGDRPEERYPVARRWLAERGYHSTLDYVRAAAIRVIEDTGLLPHLNPGVMSWEEMARL